MKIQHSIIGAAIAFLLATSCCWLPFALIALGSSAGVAAFSAGLEKWSGLFIAISVVLAGWGGWQFWQRKKSKPLSKVVLQSLITCPSCGHQKMETMPTDACQFFYECENCNQLLRPKPGDCCVYCSFGSVKCPPIQQEIDCCKRS